VAKVERTLIAERMKGACAVPKDVRIGQPKPPMNDNRVLTLRARALPSAAFAINWT
jgi:hypothetical protein